MLNPFQIFLQFTTAEATFLKNLADGSYSTGDILYWNGTKFTNLAIGGTNNVLTVIGGLPSWQAGAGGSGTVTTVSVVTANGFAGTVANATSTPAITLSTSITGILQGNGTAISAATVTGSGSVVLATSPTLTTPVLGVATITSINGLTITSSTGILTITNGKTLSVSNTLTFTGTDSSSIAFGSGGTVVYTNVTTLSSLVSIGTITTGVWTGTTIAVANGGTGVTSSTGTTSVVLSVSPTLTTPTIAQINSTSNNPIEFNAGTYSPIQTYAPSAAGTATLDCSKGNVHHITMPAGNITIALSNTTAGQCILIRILQDGTGSRTVTWFTTIKWAGGSVPILTTTASKADSFGFEVITAGSAYDGFIVGQNI